MSELFMPDEGKTIIVAPHPDDELIGCYEVIKKTAKHSKNPIVIFGGETEPDRRKETANLGKFFSLTAVLFQNSMPSNLLEKKNIFYYPDPSYEIHPLHRAYGFQGESMARAGFNVIFYNTIMNAPYIHEVEDPKDKKMYLESCYPSQSDLWKYDHKYFLFEGYSKWIF
jgi:hypothetical protein